MNAQQKPRLRTIIRPYLFIALAGILAFAPVSFMLQSLKNDIVAIEYPISYFLSQCMHNGEIPYWFNTWGMGFPLHSSLTWGIFSTPQMLFATFFDYTIYTLHAEFIFFVLLAGWSMFYLLKKYLLKDENIALLLAICYMLSGFMVGSTQWLLYITAASFIPLVVSSLLGLLYTPSLQHALQLAVLYTMMFTSVYPAFNIITTYSLAGFVIIYLLRLKSKAKIKARILGYLVLAGIFTVLLCGPCIYYTVELLNYIDRGTAIAANTRFFNSNYLHPAALSNMLLPFSSVRMQYPDTEGTMLHNYTGMFVLLLIPAAIIQTIKGKNRLTLLLLGTCILFLLLSFGNMTPARNALNILPGFPYFRNPAIFRLFFLFFLVIYLSRILRLVSLKELFDLRNNQFGKSIRNTALLLIILFLILLIVNTKSMSHLAADNLAAFVRGIDLSQTVFISSFIQLVILSAVLISAKVKRYNLAKFILITDLVINTLICTPFFSVSSYSPAEVNSIYHSREGFPVQQTKVNKAAAVYTDNRRNTWMNINAFSKEISSAESYRGPLTLKDFYRFTADSLKRLLLTGKQLIFAGSPSAGTIQLLLQKPAYVSASVRFSEAVPVTLLQNYYPGWKAYYNGKKIQLVETDSPGITVNIPKGNGIVDFRYERKFAWVQALLMHFFIICFLFFSTYRFSKRKFFTPSSLS